MTPLSPLARAFVEQTVQSAALHQKHRARIWAQLQRRVAAESAENAPHRWSARKSPLAWVTCVVASVALGAGTVRALHRTENAVSVSVANACPPVPAPACEACLAPAAHEARSPKVSSSALPVASKPTQATRSKAVQHASHPVAQSTTLGRPDPARPAAHRVAAVLPAYGSLSLENDPTRQLRAEPGFAATHTAPHVSATPFGVTADWLEMAQPLVGAPPVLVENRFESSPPLKLTPPQFKLTAALLD